MEMSAGNSQFYTDIDIDKQKSPTDRGTLSAKNKKKNVMSDFVSKISISRKKGKVFLDKMNLMNEVESKDIQCKGSYQPFIIAIFCQQNTVYVTL
jgi:hypothetical protein